ncbi:MAG TPA: FAD-dependent monooxygenase [Hyalangium sp.]|nr:FAD-dependent monooxygenase [Hyalangium sp.]
MGDGASLRASYLVGCDGGRSLIRKQVGIEFPGWDASTRFLIAEVEMTEEPAWGIRCGEWRQRHRQARRREARRRRAGRAAGRQQSRADPGTRRTCMPPRADRASTSACRTP